MYTGIDFKPIMSQKGRPAARKDRVIKNLKCWVAILAAADVIYTILAVLVIRGFLL